MFFPCAGATSPALVGLTAADLAGWKCSIHQYFDNTFPLDFQVRKDHVMTPAVSALSPRSPRVLKPSTWAPFAPPSDPGGSLGAAQQTPYPQQTCDGSKRSHHPIPYTLYTSYTLHPIPYNQMPSRSSSANLRWFQAVSPP